MRVRNPLCFLVLLCAAGCAGRPVSDGPPRGSSLPPPADAVPRREARSRHGNPPVYEVNGVRYEVMPSGHGYRERGVASWYGEKFHGRPTSSREPYDMYGMTAAHKTLPLPTYVEVRNLRNNRTVVVRVNDRGPFVDNRIIDLSYSAARKLDLLVDGTGLVEVRAIGYEPPPVETRAAETPSAEPAATSAPEARVDARIFVQVGAFGNPENARRRHAELRNSGIPQAFVLEDTSSSPALYRVRIGPIADVLHYDTLVARLRTIGIAETHLVTE